jgi:hypothetical protein
MNSNDSLEQMSSAPVSRRNFNKSGVVAAGAFAIGSSSFRADVGDKRWNLEGFSFDEA